MQTGSFVSTRTILRITIAFTNFRQTFKKIDQFALPYGAPNPQISENSDQYTESSSRQTVQTRLGVRLHRFCHLFFFQLNLN